MSQVTTIGTAAAARLPGIDFAGKTGTAQTISMEARSKLGAEGKKKYNDNAWFVGMTPRRDPQIVVAVLYQGGGWGWHSGLLAAQVIKAYVEKQRKIQNNPTAFASLDAPAVPKQAKPTAVEMSGVLHEPDGGDGLKGARIKIPVDKGKQSAKAAPGLDAIEPKSNEVKQ
jgi:penicillin-binding protein 2